MLWGLGGGCLVPIGSLTRVEGHLLTLRGAVLNPDGTRRIVDTHRGPVDRPLNVGAELAARLLSAGARELLQGQDLPNR
jgi:hydroxymethylbilane synthase